MISTPRRVVVKKHAIMYNKPKEEDERRYSKTKATLSGAATEKRDVIRAFYGAP